MLESGDRLVLFTDGISEAANCEGTLFGESRVADILLGLPGTLDAREIAARVLHEVEEHLGAEEAQDDRTLLVLRVFETADDAAAERAEPETVGAQPA
jgi:sigma-B regulation protein RsbU (phosphoserine phosphatase)